jgi:hypothetical protein
MPLLIEDGTGVENANSYVTIDELRTFATDRGVAFPAAPATTVPPTIDPAIAVFTPFLIRACDYLESLRGQFYGYESTDTQTLAWPRAGVVINRRDWPTYGQGAIPTQLKSAQCQLVVEQLNGVTLFSTQAPSGVGSIPDGPDGAIAAADGRVLIRSKIDVIEDQWSDTQGTQTWPVMPAVDGFLRPLLQGGGMWITAVKI